MLKWCQTTCVLHSIHLRSHIQLQPRAHTYIENRILRVIFVLACSFAHHFQRCCCCCSLNRAISVCCSSQLHSAFVCCNFYTICTISIFLRRLSTIHLLVCFYLALEFQMDCFRQESYRIEIYVYFSRSLFTNFFSSYWNLNRLKKTVKSNIVYYCIRHNNRNTNNCFRFGKSIIIN